MTTRAIPIIGWNSKPDASGDVWFEPYAIRATNDFWNPMICVFDDTATKIGLHGTFIVPANYVGTAEIAPYWTTPSTSGNVVWDLDYRAIGGNDTESLDQATAQQSLSITASAPSAAHELMHEPHLELTDSNLAVFDTVEWILYRDGTDANDTLSDAAILFSLRFIYSDV